MNRLTGPARCRNSTRSRASSKRLHLGQLRTVGSLGAAASVVARSRTPCRLTGLCLGQGGAGRFARGPRLADVGKVFKTWPTSRASRIGALGGDVVGGPKAFERQWRRLPNCTPSCTPTWARRPGHPRPLDPKTRGRGRTPGRGSRACGRFGHHEHAEWKCLDAWNKVDRLTVLWDADPPTCTTSTTRPGCSSANSEAPTRRLSKAPSPASRPKFGWWAAPPPSCKPNSARHPRQPHAGAIQPDVGGAARRGTLGPCSRPCHPTPTG